MDGMELSSEKAGEGDDLKDSFKEKADGKDDGSTDGDSEGSDGDNKDDHFPGSQVLDSETPSDDEDSEEGATDKDDDMDDDRQEGFAPRKLGRQSKPPSNFADEFNQLGSNKRDKEMGNVAADIQAKEHIPELTPAEVNCCEKMQELGILACNANGCEESELAMVGAGIGGGFGNTAELTPMKFDEAMKTEDSKGWVKSVDEEHDRFLKHNVLKLVPEDQVPAGEKVVSTTWVMKKKANGTLRA